jgi:hypothetical protein
MAQKGRDRSYSRRCTEVSTLSIEVSNEVLETREVHASLAHRRHEDGLEAVVGRGE